MIKDYYKLLRISNEATLNEIKKLSEGLLYNTTLTETKMKIPDLSLLSLPKRMKS